MRASAKWFDVSKLIGRYIYMYICTWKTVFNGGGEDVAVGLLGLDTLGIALAPPQL